MFNQCEEFRQLFSDLNRRSIDETRYYEVGDDIVYPSITSVISFISRKKFADWRAKVGDEKANQITKQATTRGTKLHHVLEVYLQNGDYKALDEYQVPLIHMMFHSAKSDIDKRLNNIYHQETAMFSDRLCLAGTVDLICEVDGELSVVDFKTSKQPKPEDWLENYFVQLSAYWAMFSERTQVVPKKLVVFLIAENGETQIVERTNPIHYLKILQDYVSQFIQYRDGKK